MKFYNKFAVIILFLIILTTIYEAKINIDKYCISNTCVWDKIESSKVSGYVMGVSQPDTLTINSNLNCLIADDTSDIKEECSKNNVNISKKDTNYTLWKAVKYNIWQETGWK